MKIKHKELLPDENQPFLHCKLDRQKYAGVLTSIIQNYAEGFVLALNGEWGTGKTTFVRMWQAKLKKENFKTIYFNAWENDFENEPLTALLGELKKLVDNQNDSYKSLLKKGVIITKNILPALAKGVISKYMDAGITLDVLEKSIDAATDILDKEVEEYVNKKQGLVDFKHELEKYIEANNDGKPVVFIIDELDRCRPDYAVEVLEKVKHFFSVKGIIFVLSIDKVQLGNSIQGYYGSQNINTEEYLRRFIDLEYKLPEPNTKAFCDYLYNYYQFNEFFDIGERTQYTVFRGEGERFKNFTSKLFEKYNYTLRQQEKIFAHSRIVLRTFHNDNYVFPHLFFLLIHLKERETEFYNKLKAVEFSVQGLVSDYEKIYSTILYDEIENDYSKEFISIESLLVSFYNNTLLRSGKRSMKNYDLVTTNGNKTELSFETTINNGQFRDIVLSFILNVQNSEYFGFDLKVLLSKIDLIENIE